MQKWEYCVIAGLHTVEAIESLKHYRVTKNGFELVTDFKKRPIGVSESDAVGQLIAQLGDEGWELVGAGNTGYLHTLYFKRQKP
jgi:hypothetical protein